MTYRDSIIDAMKWLAEQPDVLFLGQSIIFGGSYMGNTLLEIQESRKVEFPVAEEMQLGASLGLALEGFCVVSVYPRVNFLLLAMNQLVNHLDKIGVMSEGKMKPRIIIRTSNGPTKPLDGGPQHTGRYTDALRSMLTTIQIYPVLTSEIIVNMYQYAYKKGGIWLFIEEGDRF